MTDPIKSIVIVVPLPEPVAKLFPAHLEAAGGPPHVTLAYLPGPFSSYQYDRVCDTITYNASYWNKLYVRLLPGAHEWISDTGAGCVLYKKPCPTSEEQLKEAAKTVRLDLKIAGFVPQERAEHKPHATIAYKSQADFLEAGGVVPEYEPLFKIDQVQVWGGRGHTRIAYLRGGWW